MTAGNMALDALLHANRYILSRGTNTEPYTPEPHLIPPALVSPNATVENYNMPNAAISDGARVCDE